MTVGLKPLPASGFALDVIAALGVATAWATAGVCTTIVFFGPLESHPAAFPTARTEMPPITAATIATIAIGAERSRTDRTVATCSLGRGPAQVEPAALFTGKDMSFTQASPASRRIGSEVGLDRPESHFSHAPVTRA
jgi:hypothetical protein